MEYESDILKRLIKTYGVVGNPRYISEIIKEFIVQGKERFPELFTYQADWLAHIDEFGLNPSYTVSYTGQSIYAPNTLEKPIKSAILKGQTLVNIAPIMTQSVITSGTSPWKFAGSGEIVGNVSDNKIKISNKKDGSMIICGEVPITMKPSTKYYVQVEVKNNSSQNIYFQKVSTKSIDLTTGLNKFIITTVNDLNVKNMSITMGNVGSVNSGTEFEFSNLMIIEYQDGMENWNIPYFDGMQSVKMPVLTTSNEDGTKTNILTVNEDVELGSVGEAKDELNLLTGQLTQRTETRAYREGDEANSEVVTDMTNTRYKLPKESIKTVDLTILDQNGQNVKQLVSFNGGTHFNTGSLEGSLPPSVSVSVETDLEETLKVCSLEGNTM